MRSFQRFAWGVLAYNLAVVAWGAFVRATGSGAGCGSHWPLCNGEVVPRGHTVETAIEFTHRATSGLALLLVVGLVVWAVRAFPRGHAARAGAFATAALIVVEALVGAGLVLFGWVAKDASAARGWVVAIHLTNTFLLLGAIALTGAFAEAPRGLAIRGRGPLAAVFVLGLAATILAGATGAIAALGDTLFPAVSFAEGLRQDLERGGHVLLRLRVLHPFAAIGAAIAVSACARAALRARPGPRVRRRAVALLVLVGVELVAGAANVGLLAPVPLQLVHLLVADLVWILLVLLGAATFAPAARAPEETRLRGVAVQHG
ncbi:COX15/CtaA family protein [Anaeromyxobacter oryzae]|uniref:Cytochrome oxidase assembly protein n=1 Tax=Anaeromyxobacter oryzae TaxID=2918170 RepID=A0ABM7WW63_9BACT|nr:COX15/CtaA family protein [Anaeromyxobacter oryzae]BDG03751.1 cytochrome oxidase assembly protein [Anaeromyxobacter oryzae]